MTSQVIHVDFMKIKYASMDELRLMGSKKQSTLLDCFHAVESDILDPMKQLEIFYDYV